MSEGTSEASAAKKRKLGQRFRPEYCIEFPCLMKSTREHYAYCKYCKQYFSSQHGGRDDCRRHINSKKHVDYSKLQLGNHKVSSFFETKESPIELQVTNAEILFTNFLIEHNVPIAVSDHAGPLFRKMFPDSEIAKKYGCARTKAYYW